MNKLIRESFFLPIRWRRYSLFASVIALSLLISTPSHSDETIDLFQDSLAYADLSLAAYKTKDEAEIIVEHNGYFLSFYKLIPGVEVQVLVVTDELNKRQVIAIRGTSNVENVLVNAAFQLLLNQGTKIKLHEGFGQAADVVWSEIKPVLKNDYEISTTGHSLGGGIALILAMYLDQNSYNVGKVVTFGQPKITNVQGAAMYRHIDLTRFVTPLDLVPLVPPLDMVDLNKLDIYWHLGQEVVLIDEKKVAFLEGISSMIRATRILDKKISEENVQAHGMDVYRQHIINNSKNVEQIEYDAGASLKSLMGRFF